MGEGHGVHAKVNGGRNGVGSNEQTPLLRNPGSHDGNRGTGDALIDGVGGDFSQPEEGDIDNDGGKASQRVGSLRGLFISLSVFALIFLQAANMSGISTTQSKIAQDLDSFAEASWFTSTYLICMSSMAPVAARLAQIFSPRNCILTAAVFFALGGVITSQAPDLKTFLIGRAISGIGGAGIMTISFILVLELTSEKRRGIFIGLVNSGFTLGVSLGAVVAGALLSVTGWRFLFLIQGPLGVLAGIGIYFSIPKSFTSGQKVAEGSIASKLANIDYLGAITLVSTIVLFLFGLSSPEIAWLPILISILLLIIFLYIELRLAADPIIPITVLKSRGALLSCFAQLGIMSARWSVLFYTPVYAIAVRSWSPASAGSILVPTNFGFALGGIITGWLHVKRAGSFWLPSITSIFLFSISIFIFSQISTSTIATPLYILNAFVNGLCSKLTLHSHALFISDLWLLISCLLGAALNYTLAHLLHLTPPSTHFISTSLLTTFRGFAGSFGSAIGGGAFVRVIRSSLEKGFTEHGGMTSERRELVRKLLGSPALVGTLDGIEKQIAVDAYVAGLRALWIGATVVALVMIGVQAGTGWEKGELKEEQTAPRGREVGNGIGAENAVWEEGMEEGV
ncbi:major facilitator superfamily transporter protein [Rutstroemia sp. NJR-2017a BBW]|nr:major facilitator superfamily transporter protein [Rutstroemia sp. NJR-2017a BBW]